MATPLALVWDLVARDNASPVFGRVAASADKAAAATDRASAGAAGFGRKATAALGAIVSIDIAAHMVKSAAQFQQSMLLIQTQAGASAAEVKKMSTAVLGLAGQVGTAPEQLATSLYHIESVGFRGAKALDVLRTAAEGAKVGNADLEQTTNALTSAVASGIGGVQNISQAMGALNTIVGAGDMHLSDLTEALGSGILVAARNFGVTLTDVGAALATFGDNNVRGADAATQLRMAIMALAKPPGSGETALSKIGIQVGQLARDMRQGGLVKALNDLESHMKAVGITGSKTGEFILNAFGRKAGIGLSTLLTEIDRFNTKWKVVKDGAASFQSAWQATSHTAAFAFDRIKASVEAVGISIGLGLLPVVSNVASAIGKAIPTAISIAKDALAPFALIWQGLATVLGPIGDAFAAVGRVLSPIKGVLEGVGGALLALWAGFKLGELVVVGITAVQNAISAMALRMYTGSAGMVAAWQSIGSSAGVAAAETAAAAAVIEGEAVATSETVVAAGNAAKIGWAGLAGPIGLAIVGVLSLVSMFHESTTASKEASDAAKAYLDVLKGGGNGTELLDAIQTQLKNNNIPEELAALNKALGSTQFNAQQFADAIQHGGWQLATLRDRLSAVAHEGVHGFANITPNALRAASALGHLNTQYDALTKAAQKDLIDTKSFAGVSASIDKVAASSQVGSKVAQQYAEMVGIQVDKNGVAAVSSKTLSAAILNVSKAYDTATSAGSDFLSALSTFSQSAGTNADRAALITATLKAANGDALAYVGTLNNLAVANRQFFTDVKTNAHSAKESTREYLGSLINLRKGTIDYTKNGAAPLISDLQNIQSQALTAAGAVYQHERSIHGATRAADDAYKLYVNQTRGSLIDQATQLGLTAGQAKKLADRYFGMPKHVKTLIEQEGANPIITVLNRIGQQLSYLTHHRWNVNVDTSAAIARINALAGAASGLGAALAASQGSKPAPWSSVFHSPSTSRRYTQAVGTFAAFGSRTIPPNTRFTVGEGTDTSWEAGVSDAMGRVSIFSNAQSKAMGFRTPTNYASGTGGGHADGTMLRLLSRIAAAVESNPQQFADALNGTARASLQHARTMPAGKAW